MIVGGVRRTHKIGRKRKLETVSFFQLIARRYERNSTIVTTNMAFSKWTEVFGSATLANAILDRLLHHSSVISIKGPSYRLKDKRAFLENQPEKN